MFTVNINEQTHYVCPSLPTAKYREYEDTGLRCEVSGQRAQVLAHVNNKTKRIITWVPPNSQYPQMARVLTKAEYEDLCNAL